MDEPRWLDAEEMQIWRGFLAASARVHQSVDEQLKRDSGMGLDDYEVLVHLSEAPEQRLRMTDLSDLLLHSQSRLSQRVDRLTKRGLVERQKCPEDRRGTYAALTQQGREALEQAARGHVAEVRRSMIDWIAPRERAVLAGVFERLASETG